MTHSDQCSQALTMMEGDKTVGLTIKSLQNIDFDTLFRVFERAFVDYAVRFDKNEVRRMLRRRGFNPELSFGAFDDGDIVAFTFNGIGLHNGILTAYDIGTGTAKGYRGKGLAQDIFRHSIPFLKNAGVKQYLLEVLQDNTSAISVYQKLGFKKTREFYCFRQQRNAISASRDRDPRSDIMIKETDANTIAKISSFMDFNPSWQNSIESIRRAEGDLLCLEALIGEQLVGYSVADPQTGDLTQIAVSPEYRRMGIASMLMNELMKHMATDMIKVLNVCSTDDTLTSFLASRNISPASDQYEMILSFDNCNRIQFT